MGEERKLDAHHWFGIGTRITPMYWMKGIGILSACMSVLPIMIGGLPLLNDERDPDYDACVITLLVGLGLLVLGLMMMLVARILERAGLKKGMIIMKGVLWDAQDNEVLDGTFCLEIRPERTPGEYRRVTSHECSSLALIASSAKSGIGVSVEKSPVLRMRFRSTGIQKGDFAKGNIIHSGPESVLYSCGTVLRVNWHKLGVAGACRTIAQHLGSLHKHLSSNSELRIPVEISFDSSINTSALPSSSNAGVIGAGLGGAIGGAIGGSIQERREKERREAIAKQIAANQATRALLQKQCEANGWTMK